MRFPIIQQSADLFEADRFRHEEVDAAGESFTLVSAGREAREGDDEGWGVRGRGVGFVLVVVVVVAAGFFDVADGAGGFESVHYGHGDVCVMEGTLSVGFEESFVRMDRGCEWENWVVVGSSGRWSGGRRGTLPMKMMS